MPNSDKTVTFREITELSDLVVTGELSLQETGRIVTSTATGTARIIISSTGADRVSFPSGAALETIPGFVQTLVTPTSNSRPLLNIVGPNVAAETGGYISFTYDGVTISAQPGGSVLIDAPLTITPPAPSTFDPDFGILTGTTAPTVGTGANAMESGVYTQMGSQVIGHFTLRWSSNGSSGNGTYRIRVPKKPASTLPLNPSLGSGRIFSSTANREWLCDIRMNTSKQAIFRMGTTAGLNVTDNIPAIWVNSSDNRITGHLSYLTTE